MEQISIYLDKFKNFGFKKQILKETVALVIKNELGLNLEREDIDLKDGVININVSGSPKSEIFIKKELIKNKILDKIKNQGDFSIK